MTSIILTCSAPIYAAVSISVPEDLKIMAINNQEVNQGLLIKDRQYQLPEGVQNITLRYQAFFQHQDNSHDVLKSDVFTLTTPYLAEGAYILKLINPPQDFSAAQLYKKQPIVGLYDQNQQLVVEQKADYIQAKPRLTATSVNRKPIVDSPVTANTSTHINNRDAQLIQLWQQASTTERQKFMQWLAEQSK